MPDLNLSVTVTRDQLQLPDLDINDHVAYYLSPTFLGGQVAWNRTQVTSPFFDGAITTFRQREVVTEQIAVEVLGNSYPELKANVDTLVEAFLQDDYRLNVTIGLSGYVYRCESADYQVMWTGPRFLAKQTQVVLAVPRQPAPAWGVA